MNVQTLIVLAILAAVIFFAIKHVRKSKGCDCGCDMGSGCDACKEHIKNK